MWYCFGDTQCSMLLSQTAIGSLVLHSQMCAQECGHARMHKYYTYSVLTRTPVSLPESSITIFFLLLFVVDATYGGLILPVEKIVKDTHQLPNPICAYVCGYI